MAKCVTAPATGESIAGEWRLWGPYLADRQWGTVREDYSAGGAAWEAFPHDQARSRVYRWGEDGLLGISDNSQKLCFGLALWNGHDPILKERLFGLTGNEGNHGEDVKEYYWHQDATPSHSYLKALYKYPQSEFPYERIVRENESRGQDAPEFELIDTGVFTEGRYFDVVIEYAKVDVDDILIRITATNRGPESAQLELLPSLWFRNTWGWGRDDRRPSLVKAKTSLPDQVSVDVSHHDLGIYRFDCAGSPELLFTENESNSERLWGAANSAPYVKDGIGRFVVNCEEGTVNPDGRGTKVAARYRFVVEPGASETVICRLSGQPGADSILDLESVFAERIAEADAFYAAVSAPGLSPEERMIQRQAFAGLIWTKQFYNYDVGQWLAGDPVGPSPTPDRKRGRNNSWRHINCGDIISMPDKWEYPWFAAWDLAFHCIPFAQIDPEFAKDQLLLLLREWYMHPNGQLPAYEWAFGDVNPPVHAWAAISIYLHERAKTGTGDTEFLSRIFHKLLVNFTWWVNRKDEQGSNVFEGGFLGLDNISVFDRSAVMPEGVVLQQSDATGWMATYCLALGWIATELASEKPAYEDIARKFLDHFFAIGSAFNGFGEGAPCLWDEEDGFYYDKVRLPGDSDHPVRVRSLVGLIPIVAAITVRPEWEARMPQLWIQVGWLLRNRPELRRLVPVRERDDGVFRLLTIVPEDRLRRILHRMFDPAEFLSPYGIRSLSKAHETPYVFTVADRSFAINYEPAESTTRMFGGNSNWRGPIWFPINFMLVEALRRLHGYYGDEFTVEYPTGSGVEMSLSRIADDLSQRLASIFLTSESGGRPVFGGTETMQRDPLWRDNILFYEYFHGDNGAGIGASHQTGWTALVATLIDDLGRR